MASGWRVWTFGLGLPLALCGCQQAAERDEAPVALAGLEARAPQAAGSPAQGVDLTCSDPVRPSDTLASLKQRHGTEAREETLTGVEGIEYPALVLWPDDPARRLEVTFIEDGERTVSSIRAGEGSAWRVAGLALGDPLARVNAANGRPFTFLGFGWDYGGAVTDLAGGRLATLPGECRLVMVIGPRADMPAADGLQGDIELSSDDPRLSAADIVVWDLSLAF